MNVPVTQALSEGPLGIALLHIERGNLAEAGPLLAAAVDGGVSTGANASLFHGAPALEFVLSRAGRSDPRVQAATDRIITARLAAAGRRRASGHRPALAEFDLIRGLTGLAALLLARPSPTPLLREVLAYLASLAEPAAGTAGRELPGWWANDGPPHQDTPGGHGNNGMAHGITVI